MTFRLPTLALVAAALAAAFAAPAAAQRNTYDGPGYNRSNRFGEAQQQRNNLPGQFDYYSLVMSWSPTHCASLQRDGYDPQCHSKDGKRYAFVLHGLWPQHEKGYPEFCPIRGRPFVPQPVIDGMADIMPSSGLVIHEYKKHGTCSGLDPRGYYDLSRRLFQKIKVPERYMNPMEAQQVAPDDLADEFIKLNPGLKPDMVAVSCGGPGNRLREIRVCFDKQGQFRACGGNENQRRLCSARTMFVPPVRSSKPPGEGGDRRRDDRNDSPLPGPRVVPAPGARSL